MMKVEQLWRYPVKSMQGEPLDHATIGVRGIDGDRQWAVVDAATGLALTAKREPLLLMASARALDAAGGGASVEVTLPDGSVAADDAALSAWLGREVRLQRADPDARGTFEIAADFEDEAGSEVLQWNGPKGSFHDSNRTMVSIASLASIASWDVRRFRMNVIVDTGGEDALIGGRVRLGRAVMEVVKPIDRCVMTTRPQPGGIERDLDVLRRINAERAGNLGIAAMVEVGGVVRIGDELTPIAD